MTIYQKPQTSAKFNRQGAVYRAIQEIQACYRFMGWNCGTDGAHQRIDMTNGAWRVATIVVSSEVRSSAILTFAVFPLRVPPNEHPMAADFPARENHDLLAGNFEMNMSSGEHRDKPLMAHDKAPSSLSHFERCDDVAPMMLDRFAPGLESVNASDTPPAKAHRADDEADDDDMPRVGEHRRLTPDDLALPLSYDHDGENGGSTRRTTTYPTSIDRPAMTSPPAPVVYQDRRAIERPAAAHP